MRLKNGVFLESKGYIWHIDFFMPLLLLIGNGNCLTELNSELSFRKSGESLC